MTDTLINHCITFYNALDDRARTQKLQSGEKARVFTGSLSAVFDSLGLSRTYYSPIRKVLERHGAIILLQRGGRNADTVLVLRDLPETWEVDGWIDKGLTRDARYATLRSDIDEIDKKIGGLNIAAALMEFEERVKTLEVEVAELKKTKTTRKK